MVDVDTSITIPYNTDERPVALLASVATERAHCDKLNLCCFELSSAVCQHSAIMESRFDWFELGATKAQDAHSILCFGEVLR